MGIVTHIFVRVIVFFTRALGRRGPDWASIACLMALKSSSERSDMVGEEMIGCAFGVNLEIFEFLQTLKSPALKKLWPSFVPPAK
jgi:hypothetical protein